MIPRSAEGRRAAWWAPLLLALLVLPFAGKAHSIDDPLYLDAARGVLAHPLDPLGGPSFWHERPTTLFHDLYNPPLVAYLLAPLVAAGASEIAVHLLMIALAALALRAAAWAGSAVGVEPRWTLLVAASPALATASVSAMTDVPFLLLTVLAWGLALRGRGASGGLLAGASALAKYSGLLNALVGARVLVASRRHRSAGVLIAVAAAVFGAWCAWNLALHGEVHLRAAGERQVFDPARQFSYLASFVASLGLAGLPAGLGLLRWTPLRSAVAVAGGLAGAWGAMGATGSFAGAVMAAAAFGSGAVLLAAAVEASRRAGHPLPVWGFWLQAAYAVLLVYFGAARYAVPLLPALVWLLVRGGALDAQASPARWRASVAAGASLTLLVLWGDAGFANAWRAAALRLPVAERGWGTGHWGFQWYAGRRGYAPLSPREALRPGDVVAEPQGVHTAGPAPAQRALLDPRRELREPSPALRVMDRGVHAGFYSSAWGLLPFGFRAGAQEAVALSTPAAWIFPLLAAPAPGPVVVDVGSPEARHVALDGWSEDETHDEGGTRRTFAWMAGSESALRIPLPAGVRRVALRAFPDREAVGPMRIAIGSGAQAVLALGAGWREYEAPVTGDVAGGLTTIVLQPAGHRRPGPFSRERRELSLAVDALVFGDGRPGINRGFWPTSAGGRPGLFVAGHELSVVAGREEMQRVRLRVVSAEASLLWTTVPGRAQLLWSAQTEGRAGCPPPDGCPVELVTPVGPGHLVLRTESGVVSDLDVSPSHR